MGEGEKNVTDVAPPEKRERLLLVSVCVAFPFLIYCIFIKDRITLT